MSERKITMILPNSPAGIKCGLDCIGDITPLEDYRITIDCSPISTDDIERVIGSDIDNIDKEAQQYMIENLKSYTYKLEELGND